MAKKSPARIDSHDLALRCAAACEERKSTDVKVLDVTKALPIADYFVLVTGRNRRHLRSMADELRRMARDGGARVPREEGAGEEGRWLLLDFGDVIVHLFDAETRRYYDLDALWADAPLVQR